MHTNESVLRQKSKVFQKMKHMKTTSTGIKAKMEAFFRKKNENGGGGTTIEKAQEHKKNTLTRLEETINMQ